MKVLAVTMAHDYGDPSRGASFEETNFISALNGMGHDVARFDFMEAERVMGRAAMRRELLRYAEEQRPDVVFLCLFTDQIDRDSLVELRRRAGAPTVNWFADDHWRFNDFTVRLAPALDWCVTTDEDSLPKYEAAGVRNVILSQWACNKYAYWPTAGPIQHGVTFVGQAHAERPRVIAELRDAGVNVSCWGTGWPKGRATHEEMVEIFGTSAINLNLANSSAPPRGVNAVLARLRRWGRKESPRPAQIKGRTFEVPGCAGFELTERVPHLDRYFELGRELAVYEDVGDLVEQTKHWLENPEARQAIAQAGYARVMSEHTYDHRFSEIFDAMNLGA